MSLHIQTQQRTDFPEPANLSPAPVTATYTANAVQANWDQGITTVNNGSNEVIALESNSPAFMVQDSDAEALSISAADSLAPSENVEENHAQGAVRKMAGNSEEADTKGCTSKAKVFLQTRTTGQKVALGISAGFILTMFAGYAAIVMTSYKNEEGQDRAHPAAYATMFLSILGFAVSLPFTKFRSDCAGDHTSHGGSGHDEPQVPLALA